MGVSALCIGGKCVMLEFMVPNLDKLSKGVNQPLSTN